MTPCSLCCKGEHLLFSSQLLTRRTFPCCRQRRRNGPDCKCSCSCCRQSEGLLNDTTGVAADLTLLCPDLLQILIHFMVANGNMRDVVNLLATCKPLWIQRRDPDIWEQCIRQIGMSGNFQRIFEGGSSIATSILSLLDRKSYYILIVPRDSTGPVPWHPDAIPVHISGESPSWIEYSTQLHGRFIWVLEHAWRD